MSEAVRTAVDQLLAQPGTDGVEAWIDSQNSRSLGVARRAGLSERGRLPRVYGDRTAQSIVMVRAAAPRDPETLAVLPTVPVRDLERAIALLTGILGLHELFRHGDPPAFARLGVGPWSGSPGLQLRTDDGEIAALNIAFDIGIPTDVVLQRAVDAGLDVIDPVDDKPWSRREFTFALPEGHRIRVVGPIRPE
jgi:catechol 2,3-dioxygenase-like lactoylglutathione lyase family enzyme